MTVLIRRSVASTINRTLHQILIDQGLFHLSYFTEQSFFIFSGVGFNIISVFGSFLERLSSFIASTKAINVSAVDIIFKHALLEPIHSKRLFERIGSKSWCRLMMKVFVNSLAWVIFGLRWVLFAIFKVRSSRLNKLLTFLETVDSFSTVGCFVFAFDFLDALIGLFGFEFRVTVAVWEIRRLASQIGFIRSWVGEAVVFHLLNLTNNYITLLYLNFQNH